MISFAEPYWSYISSRLSFRLLLVNKLGKSILSRARCSHLTNVVDCHLTGWEVGLRTANCVVALLAALLRPLLVTDTGYLTDSQPENFARNLITEDGRVLERETSSVKSTWRWSSFGRQTGCKVWEEWGCDFTSFRTWLYRIAGYVQKYTTSLSSVGVDRSSQNASPDASLRVWIVVSPADIMPSARTTLRCERISG